MDHDRRLTAKSQAGAKAVVDNKTSVGGKRPRKIIKADSGPPTTVALAPRPLGQACGGRNWMCWGCCRGVPVSRGLAPASRRASAQWSRRQWVQTFPGTSKGVDVWMGEELHPPPPPPLSAVVNKSAGGDGLEEQASSSGCPCIHTGGGRLNCGFPVLDSAGKVGLSGTRNTRKIGLPCRNSKMCLEILGYYVR